MLPGPGSYKIDSEVGVKFDRIPKPLLKPKINRANPRKVLDFESLEIVKDRNAIFNGKLHTVHQFSRI